MKNKIYLYDYFSVILSDSVETDMHSHLAHQITLSQRNLPLKVKILGEEISHPFVFIPSLQKHQFFNESGSFLTILVDDESSFREKNLNIEKLESYSGRDLANKKELEGLLSELGLLDSRVFDPRIQNSLDLISSSNELEQIRSSVICKEIGLSESHFLHLFKDEMGVPFRKYILWKKLKRAISLIAIGSKPNLADIALEAGFADSAHLSNVIKASFGLSPREILKNSQFLQE